MNNQSNQSNKLYPYQEEGARLLNSRPYLFDEPGLGKSAQALEYWKQSGAKDALIVCPASLKFNWRDESELWTGSPGHILRNTKRERESRPGINITNYEQLKLIEGKRFSLVIFDEAHYLKTATSQRTKAAAELKAERKILLTGTPILNRPAELYSLLRLTGNPIAADYYKYHKQYCDMKRRRIFCKGGAQRFIIDISGSSNLSELSKKLKPYYIRRTKAEVLTQLPEKIRKHVIMGRDENTLNLTDDNFEQVIQNARRDPVSAQAFSDMRIKSALKKLPDSLEYIDNLMSEHEKVIIFLHHREPAALMIDALKQKYNTVSISGSNTAEQRDASKRDFQEGNARIAVLSLRAASTGLTLTAANTTVFFETDLTPAQNLQAEDRTHRIGQDRACTYHYLTAENSIDYHIARLLSRKQKTIKALFQ